VGVVHKFHELTNEKLAFQFYIKGRLFGWRENNPIKVKGKSIRTFNWEFGKKI